MNQDLKEAVLCYPRDAQSRCPISEQRSRNDQRRLWLRMCLVARASTVGSSTLARVGQYISDG
jgi:hypothetical protein